MPSTSASTTGTTTSATSAESTGVGGQGGGSSSSTSSGAPAGCIDYVCEGNLPPQFWPTECSDHYAGIIEGVVDVFPYCGQQNMLWDDNCSRMALFLGVDCGATRMCPHEPYQIGIALNPGCDLFDVGAAFCDDHPTCCSVTWDAACVSAWKAIHGNVVDVCAPQPDPSGCMMSSDWDCPVGQHCAPSPTCKPSVCQCTGDLQSAGYVCTNDCQAGVCLP